MSKQFRETMVGIFIIAGIILFILLYTWLSGRIGLRNTRDVVVYFDDVTGLRIGDPVTVYGIEKGKVKSLEIDGSMIRAVLALDRNIVLPTDSKIAIRSISYVGSDRYVRITPGSSEETADVYYGRSEALDLESMVNQFDSLFIMIKNIDPEDFDLNKVAMRLSRSIDKNVKRLTEMMKEPTGKFEHLVDKLDSLSTLMSTLISGDGTVGKLLKSDELYEEAKQTNQSLRELIEDIKENPKKYINIKVF